VDRTTVEVYEQRADEWVAQRRPVRIDEAVAFASRAGAGPVADLGCGPGWYADALRHGPDGLVRPVVALDAAAAMLEVARQQAPEAWRIRADLAALPFARGVLSGAWASKCYVHLARTEMPMALWDLHRSMAVEAPLDLHVFAGDLEHGPVFDDEFPGRLFSLWPEDLLRDVVVGAGFASVSCTRRPMRSGDEQLSVQAVRLRTLADTVAPDMRVLIVGLNPSLHAADAGVGFSRPGNRFWPAALAAGLVSRDRDARHALRHHGVGMTDLVKRATPRADALTADEYREGVERLGRLAAWLVPRAICVVGLAGWRSAVDRKAVVGLQDEALGDVPVYLMPSTSGANANARLDDLTEHLRAAAALADR
jgi:TDG/mug DNA glycosylase family protein